MELKGIKEALEELEESKNELIDVREERSNRIEEIVMKYDEVNLYLIAIRGESGIDLYIDEYKWVDNVEVGVWSIPLGNGYYANVLLPSDEIGGSAGLTVGLVGRNGREYDDGGILEMGEADFSKLMKVLKIRLDYIKEWIVEKVTE